MGTMEMLKILKIVVFAAAWIAVLVGSYLDGMYWMTTILVVTPVIVGLGHITKRLNS